MVPAADSVCDRLPYGRDTRLGPKTIPFPEEIAEWPMGGEANHWIRQEERGKSCATKRACSSISVGRVVPGVSS